ncbi:MAG: FkbM family methyltransferase [Verrucomicrobiaceae bacterium]|nr:MAG: FkbM family methyltransferase [Verrucomicrobiaceae bacterium]
MNDSTNISDAEALRTLRLGAEQNIELQKLKASGVLGRWQASESAIANYHAPNVAVVKTFWGGSMEVDIRETVSSQVFLHGVYEAELSAFFHRFLRPGQTFVDVGAHYGYFSLLASSRVGETGRVVSIEPSERTLWRLYNNTRKHPQVTTHRVAAWDKEDILTLNDYGPLYSAFNSIGERRIHESAPAVKAKPFQVRAVALDDFFAEIGVVPDVIKIDAESAELQVLGGLARTLKDHRPVVTLEVGDYAHLVDQGVPTSMAVLKAISASGYLHFNTTLEGITLHEIDEQKDYGYGNIIAVPRERSADFLG